MTQDLKQTDTPPWQQMDARQISAIAETTPNANNEAINFSLYCPTLLFATTIENTLKDWPN